MRRCSCHSSYFFLGEIIIFFLFLMIALLCTGEMNDGLRRSCSRVKKSGLVSSPVEFTTTCHVSSGSSLYHQCKRTRIQSIVLYLLPMVEASREGKSRECAQRTGCLGCYSQFCLAFHMYYRMGTRRDACGHEIGPRGGYGNGPLEEKATKAKRWHTL